MKIMKKKMLLSLFFCLILLLILIFLYMKNNRNFGDENRVYGDGVTEQKLASDRENSLSTCLQRLLDDGYVTNVNEIKIDIEGLEDSYTYCVINDMHIWASEEDEEINDENLELIKSRIHQNFVNANGIESKEIFHAVIDGLKGAEFDGLIMNADIIDQRSTDNIRYLKEELETVSYPYMYLRSDHDVASDWTHYDKEDIKILEKDTNWNDKIVVWEEESFIILGINKTWKRMNVKTLDRIKGEFEKGKPIILFTHVPYDSKVDEEFRINFAVGKP